MSLPPVPVLGGVTPDALKRVTYRLDRELDGAAVVAIDYSNRRDAAQVTINPELAAPGTLDAYRIQAAVMASLEGFRRYHRAVTRSLGARPEHEQLFSDAYARALYEGQQLIHHIAPSGKTFGDTQATEGAVLSPLLPDDFPCAAWLRSDGIFTLGALNDATDATLQKTLSPEWLATVRRAAAVLGGLTAGPVEAQQTPTGPDTPEVAAPELPAPSDEQRQPPTAQAPAPARAGKKRGRLP